jgi:predicted O-methyltransferase YrrM
VDKFTIGKDYLRYRLTALTTHDIHSPFVFELLNDVILDETPYYGFELIESLRSQNLLDNTIISVEDFGARSGSRKQTVSSIARNSLQPKKYSQLLFRIANAFRSKKILELGTSLGISTLYLSFPDTNNKVVTLEGSPEIAARARKNFEKLNRKNIELIEGEFAKTISEALSILQGPDLVYFDGNHRLAPTLSYFNQCLEHANENSIFIFDDIHWSKEMNDAWKQIIDHPLVTCSIDLFQLGLVFFRPGMTKQSFVLKF